ncbi:thiamine pyrophosphate-binding protein [Brevibacterium oceani]|uniref:thiamine pyrophosphate-binding protein n=1 Tax=Brevibacterium oceani TaxID=358099 RepID=UPI001B326387|nr:thiamine pyrophosphate-binding protein [Brevibacterium oceani]
MTKVYEALADAFVAEGTTHIFGMMGDANMHWMTAMAERGTTLYEARHEGSGLAMADGWARSTGKPGIASTTSGPGVTQLATSLVCASRAGTPLVVFCGEVALGDLGAVQYLDQAKFADGVEAGFVHVNSAARAQEAVQRAFFIARTESRPVIVSAPNDVQLADWDGPETYVPSTELIDTAPTRPTPERIQQASQIIAESDRVVVLLGRGARNANAGEQILELQRRTKGLLATTLQTNNWLREETPYYAGISGLYGTAAAHELLPDADCVIAIGASLNHFTTEHGYLYPDARFVQIDIADQVVTGTGQPVDCYLRGHAEQALDGLLDILGESTSEGYHTTEVRELLSDADTINEDFVSEEGLLDPREVILSLDEKIPADIPLVTGSGHQTDFGTMLFTRTREIVSNYGLFGAIGQAPMLTMGWSAGQGNRPTLVIEGDASFIMHLAEFDTACRYGWPVLVIVLDDEALGAEYHKSGAHGLKPELAAIPAPDLGAAAVALGGRGAMIRTIDELERAVDEYVADPAPTVLDVRITREVLSIPYRRLLRAEDV